METVLNPFIDGTYPDGNSNGYVSTKLKNNGLSYVPFSAGYSTSVPGTSTSTVSNQARSGGNPYGTLDAILVTVSASATATSPQGYSILFQFMGKEIGICWELYRNSNGKPICGFVDGQAFELPNIAYETTTSQASAMASMINNTQMIPVTLDDDGPHECRLVFPGYFNDSSRAYLLYGWVGESRLGYGGYNPVCFMSTYTLTTQASDMSIGRKVASLGKTVRKLVFSNTTGGPVTLYLENDGIVYLTKVLASGEVYVEDFGDYVQFTNTASSGSGIMRAYASAGSSIIMNIIGRTK